MRLLMPHAGQLGMSSDEDKGMDSHHASSNGEGKRLPRDSAGFVDLPPEHGGIKAMVGFDGFIEIYTVHATYCMKTPDDLDPKRTVPYMPWSQSLHAPVGASNPIVARIVIELVDALGNWPLRNGDRGGIKRHLRACKEDLLVCETTYSRLKAQYDAIVKQITEKGLKTQRNVVECPSLPNVRDEAAAFLSSAKRALQCVGEIFNQFYVPDDKKPSVANANFEFAISRLKSSEPIDQELISYLEGVVPTTKYFVDLRNGLEHPGETDATVIEDFRLIPEGIIPPSWRRGIIAKESPIIDKMREFLGFAVDFCEHVFFFGLTDNILVTLPHEFSVEPIPRDQIDLECPVRYRFGLSSKPRQV